MIMVPLFFCFCHCFNLRFVCFEDRNHKGTKSKKLIKSCGFTIYHSPVIRCVMFLGRELVLEKLGSTMDYSKILDGFVQALNRSSRMSTYGFFHLANVKQTKLGFCYSFLQLCFPRFVFCASKLNFMQINPIPCFNFWNFI